MIMNQFKKAQIIMLPTDDRSKLCIDKYRKTLEYVIDGEFTINTNKQQLYIISDDEIKEGDWVLSKLNEVVLLKENYT
ncbi:hypothetical protein ABK046_49500, partial [Streptomyces caeruleatus]